ncbi:peptidyl-prolyl cis-trans isomerase CYP7 [Diutina catenulata]
MPSVYLDIAISDTATGRVVVQLDSAAAPHTTARFLELASSGQLDGTVFHEVIKNLGIQGGILASREWTQYPPADLGRPEPAAVDPDFAENLDGALDAPFKVCMDNGAANPDHSQFFITLSPQPRLQGQYTVFGDVVHGKSVVREVERVSTYTGDHDNMPKEKVVVTKAGEWGTDVTDVPVYNACYDQIGGDIYEEYPDDDTHIEETSESAFKVASTIKESGTLLFKQGRLQDAYFKWRKCVRYCQQYDPDVDAEPEWSKKILALKKSCYLNLALVCDKLGKYSEAVAYAGYVLDMDTTPQERAKALFRRATAKLALRQLESAVEDLESATALVDDAGIARELERARTLVANKKNAQKQQYAKFFG